MTEEKMLEELEKAREIIFNLENSFPRDHEVREVLAGCRISLNKASVWALRKLPFTVSDQGVKDLTRPPYAR